jgi:flavin-dependent dehydrogenase
MFSFFFLTLADRLDLKVTVDVFEPKDFNRRGPAGCNMCGGIISESLVQALAAEGINLPSSVVQRGIEGYVLHTDAGTVRIDTPIQEKRIGAVHRGAGPLKAPDGNWQSLDGFLQSLAVGKGAQVVPEAVVGLEWHDGRPVVKTRSGIAQAYDLLVVATGVNTTALKLFTNEAVAYRPPKTTRTITREYHLGAEELAVRFGDAMHLFLLNIPRLEFAAIIPKGNCATLCMLGDDIDRSLLQSFAASPAVNRFLENGDGGKEACACSPRMAISAANRPYANRLIFVGDCGVTRLYKDGIGAAYRTAKAAATTAMFQGVSAHNFEKHFLPVCRAIIKDNRFGRIVFLVTRVIQRHRLAQRVVLQMVYREHQRSHGARRMSAVLWDTFTGSAPYREIFLRTLRPTFLVGLARNFIGVLLSRVRSCEGHGGTKSSDGEQT